MNLNINLTGFKSKKITKKMEERLYAAALFPDKTLAPAVFIAMAIDDLTEQIASPEESLATDMNVLISAIESLDF